MSRPRRIVRIVGLIAVLSLAMFIGTYTVYRPRIAFRQKQARSHRLMSHEYSNLLGSLDTSVVTANRAILPPGGAAMGYSLWEGPISKFDSRLGYVISWSSRSDGKTPDEFEGVRRAEIEELSRERVEYHTRMTAKWSRAVWFPWSKVEPDELTPPITFSGVVDTTY